MPILWRYFLSHYVKMFFLILCGFIGVLLIMRSQEIARYAALGASLKKICLFSLYQIPYILPIAIPIATLIASYLLMQKLSGSNELTALRSLGLSFKELSIPLYFCALILALANLFINSSLTPYCRRLSKELSYKTKSVNPLILIQKSKMLKLSDSVADLKMYAGGRSANDCLFVTFNPRKDRLILFSAKNLFLSGEFLKGSNVSIITTHDSKTSDDYDHLSIENNKKMHIELNTFNQLFQERPWAFNHEYLPLKYLIIQWMKKDFPSKSSGYRTESEIIRRFFLSLASFSFTMLGVIYGFNIGREKKGSHLLWVVGLASFSLVCFLIGKSLQLSPLAAFCFYFFPHPICIFIALRHQKFLDLGIEK